jgi:hypothetical protein
MGYRSQVSSIIYESKEKLDAFKDKNKGLLTMLEDEFNDGSLKYIETPEYNFIYLQSSDGWKWYDSFKEVKGWHDLMDKADEDKLAVEFVRIGEDYEDIETDYRGDSDLLNYYLSVERFVEANF